MGSSAKLPPHAVSLSTLFQTSVSWSIQLYMPPSCAALLDLAPTRTACSTFDDAPTRCRASRVGRTPCAMLNTSGGRAVCRRAPLQEACVGLYKHDESIEAAKALRAPSTAFANLSAEFLRAEHVGRLPELARALRAGYAGATPFPHVVLDDLFAVHGLRSVLSEVPEQTDESGCVRGSRP